MRRLFVLLLLAASTCTSPVFAQTPTPAPLSAKAVLAAPEHFEPGEPILFDAGESIGTDFRWKVTSKSRVLMVGDGRKQAATWTSKNSPIASDPFAVQLTAIVSDAKGNITSFDSDIVILSVLAVDPPKPPAPPGPDPAPEPVPDDAAKISHACFVLFDSWTARAKSVDLMSMRPESKTWAAIRAAGHDVLNIDTGSQIAASPFYSKFVGQAPVLLVFDRNKNQSFVRAVKVGSIADVRKAVKDTTGTEVP